MELDRGARTGGGATRALATGTTGGAGSARLGLWLKRDTIAALRGDAARRGLRVSELVEELLAAGWAAQASARLEERALPVFTAAVERALDKHLRRQERRDAARLAPLARDAGMAARVAYAHLYHDHPDQAEAEWQQASAEIEAALEENGLPLTDGPTNTGDE